MSGCLPNLLSAPRHSSPSMVCISCYLCWWLLEQQREDESLDAQLFNAFIEERFGVLLPPTITVVAPFTAPFPLKSYVIMPDYEAKALYIEKGDLILNLTEVEVEVGASLAETINAHILTLAS